MNLVEFFHCFWHYYSLLNLLFFPFSLVMLNDFSSIVIAKESTSWVNFLIGNSSDYDSSILTTFFTYSLVLSLITPLLLILIFSRKAGHKIKEGIDYFRWWYFALSVAGAIVTAFYTQTGTIMAISGTIEDRLLEKAGDLVEKWEEKKLKKQELEQQQKLEQQQAEEETNRVFNQILENSIEIERQRLGTSNELSELRRRRSYQIVDIENI